MIDEAVSKAKGSLANADVEEFKTKLRGELILPADEGYDKARSIWNGMFDKRPALVVQ